MIDAEVIYPTIDRSVHTVLVVDDNPATRYATGRVIRAAGFQTAEAGSGAEALDLIARGVSAAVLDVHLPDIDGFELCRRIRANPAASKSWADGNGESAKRPKPRTRFRLRCMSAACAAARLRRVLSDRRPANSRKL